MDKNWDKNWGLACNVAISPKLCNFAGLTALPPVHPGEILKEDYLNPMGITRYRLAKGIGVPQRRIDEICAGKRAITADTALRLARFFGTDAQSWMNLQTHYDLEKASISLEDRLLQEVKPLKTGSF